MSDEVDLEALMQDGTTPYAMASRPAASFRARGYDYDHEVLVTLPPSYDVSPQRAYPVVRIAHRQPHGVPGGEHAQVSVARAQNPALHESGSLHGAAAMVADGLQYLYADDAEKLTPLLA